MTARNQNPPQPIPAGDSFSLAFPITIVGPAIDLTEAGAQYGVYVDGRDGERKIFKTKGQGVRLTQEDGVWTLYADFDAEETEGLVGDYYHEATVIPGGGQRHTIATGTIRFSNTRNDEPDAP